MASHLAFTTAVKNHAPIDFTIDGEEYHFTPPKTARISLAALKAAGDDTKAAEVGLATIDWLSEGLPDEEATRLRARLENPKDEFDLPDLVQIAESMWTEVAGRPFGSRPGSSPSPANTGTLLTPTPLTEDSTPLTSPSTDSSAG